jgi:RNA ligase (TIGR02306 family)
MSEFKVTVVRVGPISKHENADTLGVTKVFDYPVIVKLGEFKEGDLAVYVPVDAVVPGEDSRWAFLQGHNRIKARKLRGIFSMGLLAKFDADLAAKASEKVKGVGGQDAFVGLDVADILGIKKYEPPEPVSIGGDNEKCLFEFPQYTDIEGLRRWPDVLREGEDVVITEKIHGCNGRWVYKDGRLWVGSHTSIKRDSPNVVWWKAAHQYELEKRLSAFPEIVVYGEVYGWVQDLRYGHSQGKVSIALFDAMDLATKRYFDADEFLYFARKLGLPTAPELYRGPWNPGLKSLAEGKTTLGADHVREGIVIRPVKERVDERIGRVILKYHGEGYLLR